jgi:hypothetical protein
VWVLIKGYVQSVVCTSIGNVTSCWMLFGSGLPKHECSSVCVCVCVCVCVSKKLSM